MINNKSNLTNFYYLIQRMFSPMSSRDPRIRVQP
ncbi:hypothetical protein XAB3213_980025 [Xanthomonas citri pv. bilvae]|nr:hypothetical protein XAB3213_980025 [Xanthomonas citri pv. bilvae]